MVRKVQNFKVCSQLKLSHGLTGEYHAICHYSCNLPLAASGADDQKTIKLNHNNNIMAYTQNKSAPAHPTDIFLLPRTGFLCQRSIKR